MQNITIQNETHPLPDGGLVAQYCSSFFCQLRGLMFRRSLPERGGLLLVQTRESRVDASIHMFFMYMDLAVVWINDQNRVVDVRPAYRWRSMLVPAQPARYVLELPISRLNDFNVGDYVEMGPIPDRF